MTTWVSLNRIEWQAAALLALLVTFAPVPALGHGGVMLEDDLCVIKVGYLEAHFKVYLPRTRQRSEFCEDLPDTGEAVFVMEYLHSRFGDVPIEFRVIRNVTGLGRFARWQDVAALTDLEPITVFHQGARTEPDVFTVVLDFEEPGEYIGIVTATPPNAERAYSAVFPFEVGFTGFGYWPWLLLFMSYLFGTLWVLLRRRLAA